MRERLLGNLTRESGFVGCPISKRASHPMNRRARYAKPCQDLLHRYMRKRPVASWAWEDKLARFPLGEPFEDFERPTGEWNPVLAPTFHAMRRNSPNFRRHVDFRPTRAENFARTRGGEDAEF